MRRMLLLLFAFALFHLPALAQQDRGAFTGTITEQAGAAVANARVTIRNTCALAPLWSET